MIFILLVASFFSSGYQMQMKYEYCKEKQFKGEYCKFQAKLNSYSKK